MEKADKLKENLDPTTVERIQKIVARVQSLSFDKLLKEIYDQYPEYSENSVFQPQPL